MPKTLGENWDLKQKMVYWIYNLTITRPILTDGVVVWLTKVS